MCHVPPGTVNPPEGTPVPVTPAPSEASRAGGGHCLPLAPGEPRLPPLAPSQWWHMATSPHGAGDKLRRGVTSLPPRERSHLPGLLGGTATGWGGDRAEQGPGSHPALWTCQVGEHGPHHSPPCQGNCHGPCVPEESSATTRLETQIYCNISLQPALSPPRQRLWTRADALSPLGYLCGQQAGPSGHKPTHPHPGRLAGAAALGPAARRREQKPDSGSFTDVSHQLGSPSSCKALRIPGERAGSSL